MSLEQRVEHLEASAYRQGQVNQQHTAGLAAIEGRLADIDGRLDAIEGLLLRILTRLGGEEST